MKIRFKKLDKSVPSPFKKYPSDFCWDLYATSCEEIAPNVYKYGLGIAIEMERGWETILKGSNIDIEEDTLIDLSKLPFHLSLDLRPRSSVWKTGMVLSNSQGTVDELFRGSLSAVFYHLLTDMPKYEVGDRIIQAKIGITLPIEWEEVKELSDTDRGANGYGSTGQK